jgi:hypothetical protein
MLDLAKLEHVRQRGAKVAARCPACAEQGADRTGNHLFIADDGTGPFGCIMFPGPAGDDHRKRIYALAGDGEATVKARPVPFVRPRPQPKASPIIPPLRPLNCTEMAAIAHLRGWSTYSGLQLLADRGLLWYGDVPDDGRTWPAWVITDASRRNAQARRLDGGLWHGIGGAKAKTLPGCDPSWPIGADRLEHHAVLLCEGQPDFCAALLVAWWEGVDVSPVCITGAGNAIHSDALPQFKDRHIRIAMHDDEKGCTASEQWAGQLYEAGASRVSRLNFAGMVKADGQPLNDLADFATLIGTDLPASPPVLTDMNGQKGG